LLKNNLLMFLVEIRVETQALQANWHRGRRETRTIEADKMA
jgi:hypothetical protein